MIILSEAITNFNSSLISSTILRIDDIINAANIKRSFL